MGATVSQLVRHASRPHAGGLPTGLQHLLGGDPVDHGVGQLVADCIDMGLGTTTTEPVGEASLDNLVDDLLDGRGA